MPNPFSRIKVIYICQIFKIIGTLAKNQFIISCITLMKSADLKIRRLAILHLNLPHSSFELDMRVFVNCWFTLI